MTTSLLGGAVDGLTILDYHHTVNDLSLGRSDARLVCQHADGS